MDSRDEPSVDGNGFDHARLDIACYNGLDGVDDAASFSDTVVDYMRYIRDDPASRAGWDNELEMRAAERFTEMINNENTWGLARCVVPEFQMPMTDTTRLPDPLRYVLDSVAPRLPRDLAWHDPPVAGDEQSWEEDLLLRQECRLIEYIGWRAGQVEGGGGADERRVGVDMATSTLRTAAAVVRKAREADVREGVDGGETERGSKETRPRRVVLKDARPRKG
ncbi:hypothetical protein PV04_09834 [Phialophora macrospora]|uniref:Uncharacterized protein n=1 Tax=Phialophora macrospora TaxID=1851006 RepID=A0A0D2F7K8_9EURO|nr:hypothetical protein PV04_09834 [Phialophora macrospora]